MNIIHVQEEKLLYKPLHKLVARWSKKYTIPEELIPNFIHRRNEGAIFYLFRRRYEEKSLGAFEKFLKCVL